MSARAIQEARPSNTARPEEKRFAECRRRVAANCGGTHIRGPQVGEGWFWYWRCCATCPDRAELNPHERVFPRLLRRPVA